MQRKLTAQLNCQKPKSDCAEYKSEINAIFNRTLNQEGIGLVDLETIVMLSSAMTSFLEPIEAIKLVLYDSLLLFEDLGWTQTNWSMHVNNFPSIRTDSAGVDMLDRKGISDDTWTTALKHLKIGGNVTELVTKLGLTVEQAEQIAKKFVELNNLDSKINPRLTGKENSDKEIRRLEREVQMAELKKKKFEYEKPLETDKALSLLNETINEAGRYRQETCSHMERGFCMFWRWAQKPKLLYMNGEPLFKENWWYISPTQARCAVCPKFFERGTLTIQDFETIISKLEKVISTSNRLEIELQSNPFIQFYKSFKCPSCGSKKLFAVQLKCTRCDDKSWGGYYP